MRQEYNSQIKKVQAYPMKLSQPMGATLAVMGVKGAMALAHGAVGCSSLTKIFFTRHFCDPIAIRSTAVSELIAIFDGGDGVVAQAVDNLLPKVKPEIIGLFSTGLTSAKGDDLRRIAKSIDYPIVYADTPDFEGALESGWAKMTTAFVEQLVEPYNKLKHQEVLILPHVSMTSLEVEKLKELVESFGLKAYALPDLSDSLDGHLGNRQTMISDGGISVEKIHTLANAGLIISVGASMLGAANCILKKAVRAQHIHLKGVMGLKATDELINYLMEYSQKEPSSQIKQWRKRYQDALLDSHFSIGRNRFILAGEPDRIVDMATAIREAGATISAIVSTTESESLKYAPTDRVIVGDLEDVESMIEECDILITNYHGTRIAFRNKKACVLRGFPILEQIGVSMVNDALYEGGTHFLIEVANSIINHHIQEELQKSSIKGEALC